MLIINLVQTYLSKDSRKRVWYSIQKALKDNDIFFKTILGISNDTLIHNFLPNTVHEIVN